MKIEMDFMVLYVLYSRAIENEAVRWNSEIIWYNKKITKSAGAVHLAFGTKNVVLRGVIDKGYRVYRLDKI